MQGIGVTLRGSKNTKPEIPFKQGATAGQDTED